MLVLYHFFELYFEFQYMGLFRQPGQIDMLDRCSGRMQEMSVHRRAALRDGRVLRSGVGPSELTYIVDLHLRPSAFGRRWALSVAATQKTEAAIFRCFGFFQLINK